MTKRDFFILIIKLLGLYYLVSSLISGLPSSIIFSFMYGSIVSSLWVILSIIITIGVFVLLVFKADIIAGILELDKGFDDERIELNTANSTTIVKIGTFLLGGFMMRIIFRDSLTMFFMRLNMNYQAMTCIPKTGIY
jgi:hypothetical protein